jgi:serine/threonine protein kinase
MLAVDVDRNLLFGVIALQDDLIDQKQFTEACAVWALRMDSPLADVLVERRWITPDERREIERKIERKVKKHGNVRASLGAAAGVDARDAIRAVDHPDIRKSLSSLPPTAGHVLVETLVPPYRPEQSRYTLTRLHAQGGLGKVWLAHDGDLRREVALKEILPERAGNPETWRRFLKEAQITGQLEHPNIVPVYELSRRKEDDQPFYVMRFVRGQSLLDAIRDFHRNLAGKPPKRLALQTLLGAFLKICDAVAYAHSRGVVHRDLKPENIILGGFGEVIVLDWGLAKLVDQPEAGRAVERISITSDDVADKTHGHMGTPSYMAPEQVEQKHDVIDGRTDVYALGAILFEILTGHPPAEGTCTAEVFEKIRSGRIPRARQIDPAVPRALEAVCSKALAVDRAQRYATPTDLANDVRRWLADEPVSAWREPWSNRAHRFMRRHRSGVFASTCTLIIVSLVLGISMAVVTANNVMLDRERRRADANAAFLLQGLTESLKRLANPALARDPECQESTLAALREGEAIYLDLMDSERRLGTSPSRISALWVHVALLRTAAGSRQGTLDAYRRAIEATAAAESLRFGDSGPLIDAAGARMHLGLDLWVHGEGTEATEQLRRAATGFGHALELVPEDPEWVRNAAWFHLFCPDLRIRDSRLALELAERLVRREDSLGRDRPRLSEGIRPLFTLALAHYRVGNRTTARKIIEESIRRKATLQGTTIERLVETKSAIDAYDWFVWSMTLARLGEYGAARGRFDEAETWMRRNRYGDFELHLLKKEAEELLRMSPGDSSSAFWSFPIRWTEVCHDADILGSDRILRPAVNRMVGYDERTNSPTPPGS